MRKSILLAALSLSLVSGAQTDPKQTVQDTVKRTETPMGTQQIPYNPAPQNQVDVQKEQKTSEPTQKGEKKAKSNSQVKKENPKN